MADVARALNAGEGLPHFPLETEAPEPNRIHYEHGAETKTASLQKVNRRSLEYQITSDEDLFRDRNTMAAALLVLRRMVQHPAPDSCISPRLDKFLEKALEADLGVLVRDLAEAVSDARESLCPTTNRRARLYSEATKNFFERRQKRSKGIYRKFRVGIPPSGTDNSVFPLQFACERLLTVHRSDKNPTGEDEETIFS